MGLDLEARKGKIGSSDIAAVCGLNPWRTPLQIWAEMTGRVKPEPENDAMWLGTELESTVAKFWAKKSEGGKVIKAGVTKFNDKVPFACATPDYIYTLDNEVGILECKTTGSHNKDRWKEAVPDYVHCQVMWQMGILEEFEDTIVACLCDRELINNKFKYEEPIFDQLVHKGHQFMEMVKSDTPPSALGADKELLLKLHGYPEIMDYADLKDDVSENLIARWLKLDKEKKTIAESAKEIEKAQKDIQAQIVQRMGGAAHGRWSNGSVKYSHSVVPEAMRASYETFRFTIKENK